MPSDPFVAVGLAGLGAVVTFALGEVYDAWKYSHHPDESIRREVRTWSLVVAVWAFAVGVAYYV